MKNCPYCAEEIQDDAIKCKHCGATDNLSSYGLRGIGWLFAKTGTIMQLAGWLAVIAIIIYFIKEIK